jgi:quercetin dioxygenase-like cupin family protein
MFYSKRLKCAAAILGIAMAGTTAAPALASPPSGVTTTNFVTADLDPDDHINNDRIKFQTKDATDVRVQKLVFAAGATTGWHHHPGMVIVVVESGLLTLWRTDCSKTVYGPGSPNGAVFVEGHGDAHQATTDAGMTLYATYVVPSAAPPVFRIEDQIPFCAQ